MGMVNLNLRTKRYLLPSIVIFVFISMLFFLMKNHAPLPLTMTFLPTGVPAVTLPIGSQSCLVAIDLGSKFELSLNPEILNTIVDKEFQGTLSWKDAKGFLYEAASYKIPKVTIGNIDFYAPLVKEIDPRQIPHTMLWDDAQDKPLVESSGTLGRALFEATHLILDFPQKKLFVLPSERKLTSLGIEPRSMVRIPFDPTTKGIILHVESDLGPLRLGLDTGTTISLMRQHSLLPQGQDIHGLPFIVTQKFEIGGHDFGAQQLTLYDMTPELTELDGIIGMDFLKTHTLYIDYPGHTLYLSP